MLHEISPRQSKPFVSVNCAAIPDTLVESELFGVERGAYTGAVSSRAGRFERADSGTLFLDEVSSLNLVAQGKLLRVSGEASSIALFAVAEVGRLSERTGGARKSDTPDIFRALAELTGSSDTDRISIDVVDHALMNLALEQSGGKLSGAARLLGLTRAQLSYRLQKRNQGGRKAGERSE